MGYRCLLSIALLLLTVNDSVADSAAGIAQRIQGRNLPSVFQAWSKADNLPQEDELTTLARHDLLWNGPAFFGLQWAHHPDGQGMATAFTAESITRGLAYRSQLLERNPNMVLIAEIRYYDAWNGYIREDSDAWMRDNDGNRVPGWEEGGFWLLDYPNPEYQDVVAAQCRAVVETGVVDGVMLDWWQDNPDQASLINKVRTAIGPDALIIANSNARKIPNTAASINGIFMETTSEWFSTEREYWTAVASTLTWAEQNLREPRINCLETWYLDSRRELNRMRANATLVLTHSDGYCLFGDPNTLPTHDHLHDWYPFWNKSLDTGQTKLGKALEKGKAWSINVMSRPFEHGTVVYNRAGNQQVALQFSAPVRSSITGMMSDEHTVDGLDGDIFLGIAALTSVTGGGAGILHTWNFDDDAEGWTVWGHESAAIPPESEWTFADGTIRFEYRDKPVWQWDDARILQPNFNVQGTHPLYCVLRMDLGIAHPAPDHSLQIKVRAKAGEDWSTGMVTFDVAIPESGTTGMETYIVNLADPTDSDPILTPLSSYAGTPWGAIEHFMINFGTQAHDGGHVSSGDYVKIDAIALVQDYSPWIEEDRLHSADINKDKMISLDELLRVIQLFNAGQYHCDPTSEDGYAAGPGAQTCGPHDSDYAPVDRIIALSELLRLVQFYNSAGFEACSRGEDGLCI
jgi:hypothetical protein